MSLEHPTGLENSAMRGQFSSKDVKAIADLAVKLKLNEDKVLSQNGSNCNTTISLYNPKCPSEFFQKVLEAGFPFPENVSSNPLANIAAIDTRKNNPVPGLNVLQMKGGEYDVLISSMADALLDFVDNVTDKTASRIHKMVVAVVKALFLDIKKYCCYCQHIQQLGEMCTYCKFNKMAGLEEDNRKNQIQKTMTHKHADIGAKVTIGWRGVNAVKLVIQGIRRSAEVAQGSTVGTHALLAMTGNCAAWYLALSNQSAVLKRPKVLSVAREVAKHQPIFCSRLKTESIDSPSFLAVAQKTPSIDQIVQLPVLSIGWFAAQGSAAMKPYIGEVPTRLDATIYQDVFESESGLYDYDGDIMSQLGSQDPDLKPLYTDYPTHGTGMCGAFTMLNRCLIDSATITRTSDPERVQLGIMKDGWFPGDRWLVLWATAYSDFGAWGGTLGQSLQDGASTMYGYGFSIWINCLTDMLSERGCGESANAFTWLDEKDSNALQTLITSYMRHGFVDKGYHVTVKTSIWNWCSGRHRTCSMVARSIRAESSSSPSGLMEAGDRRKVYNKLRSEFFPLLSKNCVKPCLNWLREVKLHFDSDFGLPAEEIKELYSYLELDSTAAGPVEELQNPCCAQHTQMMQRVCAEQFGIAFLCIVAALQPNPDRGNDLARFCDKYIPHFCPETRATCLHLCGCEGNLAKYHGLLYWGELFNCGRMFLPYSRMFSHAERPPKISHVQPYIPCKICKLSNL